MISPSSIERLKQSIDIVDLISNYLELKKTGANYKTKCPFHSEKTSSFVVSPSKQIFHCFGCKVGGDAIKFVMKIENLSYPEAIEKIAFIYNIPLEYENSKDAGEYLKITQALESIQEWYRKNLDSSKNIQEYLKNRGLTQASIEEFGVGYAPKSGLIEFLKSKLIPLPKAKDAGVLNEDETSGKVYARFVDRVTFPIYSQSGLLVGFGGRSVSNHPAKYLNSPQTKIFNKSKLLYGYHRAKEHIFRQKEIIVCEGYLDVIMLHQAGFKKAVATLGTALTREHLPLIKKSKARVILAYDGDSAGINAAFKASKMLAQDGVEGGVVLFPEGLDPADMVLKNRIKELDLLFREAKDLIVFVIEHIANSFDLNNPTQKEEAFLEVRRFLDSLSPIIKEAYIDKASLSLGISPSYFKVQNINQKSIPKQKRDVAWEAIIKTILQNDRVLEEFLDIFSPKIANGYEDAIQALIDGNLENPELLSILVNDDIKPLDEMSFKKALLIQLERFYLKKLEEIKRDNKVSYSHKSYWIRKIKTDILPRIKRGELIVYESNIPI
jgi:DNA primase